MPQALHANPIIEFAQSAIQAVLKVAKNAAESVLNFSDQLSVANSRQAQIEQMNLLTDRELADTFQINRDQIVGYVFRDKMF
jgi:hypothetical protein